MRFEGTEGWISVCGARFDARPRTVLGSVIGPGEIHLYRSRGPHRNFLDCIRSRRPTAASAEIGHRATTTCNLVEISARLGRKIRWDPANERCVGDGQANRMLSRALREPWRL